MRKDYEKLFNYLESPELPVGLFDKVMNRISEEQKLIILRRRFAIFSVSFIGSIVAFIPTFKMAQTGLVESGFMDFFSLIFSDVGIVMAYWQNFIMTLLESLPVISIIAFLATIFVFLGSLKFLVKDMKFIFKHTQIINN